jgi:hypothetical protein
MRRASSTLQADQARAELLAAQLSAPPGLLMRLWMGGAAVTGVLLVVLLVAWAIIGLVMCIGFVWSDGLDGVVAGVVLGLILGIPLTYNEALHSLAHRLHTDWADVLGAAGSYAVLGLVLYLLIVMPIVLGLFADSFETVRATLRSIMSAKPPRVPGGPAECRECGAALELRAGVLHARCMYCGTESLVEVPDALVAKAKADVRAEHRDLESAFAAERSARWDGLALLGRRLLVWLALVPVLVLLGRIVAWGNNDASELFWRTARPGAPRHWDGTELPRGHVTPFRCRLECDEDVYVALAAGEKPHLAITQGKLSSSHFEARDIGHFYNPTYTWKPIDLSRGAPYSGWYRVKFIAYKEAANVDLHVEWNATR